MLYLEFWNSFWKQWSDLAENGDDSEAEPSPAPGAINAQEKYNYLTEYGTQILCLLDATQGCLYLSRNFETITGMKRDARLGEKFFGIVHGDFRARLKEILAGSKEKPASPFRCKLQHADKKYYWHQFRIYPKQEAPGECVCIIENIHDNMLTQNTLQKARLEAELALRARSEFLANMSHELRTPLNAVIGFSQIIESEMFGKIENPQYIEYVKHIQESGYDLLAKIEDLLEIADIDAGRVQLAREEVYAGDILRQVADAQKHHAHAAQVALETPPLDVDMLLYVDRLKLQHILGHLVANAIKFSREGGRVTLACEKTGGGRLLFTVHDAGSGMSDVKLDAIVTALKEDNCWTAGNNRSIGLGLALTREFVALHGGNVNVESKPGDGTTVTINLPKHCVRAALVKTADYLQVAN